MNFGTLVGAIAMTIPLVPPAIALAAAEENVGSDVASAVTTAVGLSLAAARPAAASVPANWDAGLVSWTTAILLAPALIALSSAPNTQPGMPPASGNELGEAIPAG